MNLPLSNLPHIHSQPLKHKTLLPIILVQAYKRFLISRTLLLPKTALFSTTRLQMSPWEDDLPKPVDELNTYLCVMPDFVENSRRLDVRPQHLKEAAEGHRKGWVIQAGAMFEQETGSKMIGSWFLLREQSKEAALERLSKDVYADVAWDMRAVSALGCAT